MNDARQLRWLPAPLLNLLGSARFAHALTLVVFGTLFSAPTVRALIGWPGYVAVLTGLVVLCAASLSARRRAVEWYGILPLTILVFVGWCTASLIWTDHILRTLNGVIGLITVAFLGIYIALMRDTIQIVRSVGDVLRVLLGLSIALEIFAGLLIDSPIPFLGVQGDLGELGPIQGVFGSRNLLGIVSLVAGLTFVVEWRTRSVPRARAIFSVVLAALCLLLSGSPTTLVALAAVLASMLALWGLRHVKADSRWRWQLGMLVAIVVGTVLAWLNRARIIELLDARDDFEVRLQLWREILRFSSLNQLQGWGWVGRWPDTWPYTWIEYATGRPHASALDVYLDVYFQVGLIGVFCFVAMLGVALVRSWLLASARRSVVYVWPALVLVVVAVTGFAESWAIIESGWLLLTACAVKAARDMSWRDALPRRDE